MTSDYVSYIDGQRGSLSPTLNPFIFSYLFTVLNNTFLGSRKTIPRLENACQFMVPFSRSIHRDVRRKPISRRYLPRRLRNLLGPLEII